MTKTKKETLAILEKRRETISAFINSRSFSDHALKERQQDKKSCAMYYLEELEEVISVVDSSKEDSHFSFVSNGTFENCGKYADFCTIEFDSVYFQVKHVITVTGDGVTANFYIYAFPISKILL